MKSNIFQALALLFLINLLNAGITFTPEQAQDYIYGNPTHPYVQNFSIIQGPNECCGSMLPFFTDGTAYTYEFGHPENVRVGDAIIYFKNDPYFITINYTQTVAPNPVDVAVAMATGRAPPQPFNQTIQKIGIDAAPILYNGMSVRGSPMHQVIWRSATNFIVQGTNQVTTLTPDGNFTFDGHFIARVIPSDPNLRASMCAFAAANRTMTYAPEWACGPVQLTSTTDWHFIRNLTGNCTSDSIDCPSAQPPPSQPPDFFTSLGNFINSIFKAIFGG